MSLLSYMYDIWTNELNCFIFQLFWQTSLRFLMMLLPRLQMELMVYMGIYINCWRMLKIFQIFHWLSASFSQHLNLFCKASFTMHITLQWPKKIDHLVTDCKGLVPDLTLFWVSVLVRSVLIATSNRSTGQLSDLFYFRFFNQTFVQICHFPHLCCMFHTAHHFYFHHFDRILWNLQTMKPLVM